MASLFYAIGPPALTPAGVTTSAPLLSDGLAHDIGTGYTLTGNAANNGTDDLYVLIDFGVPTVMPAMDVTWTTSFDLLPNYASSYFYTINHSDGATAGANWPNQYPLDASLYVQSVSTNKPDVYTVLLQGTDTIASRFYFLHLWYRGTAGEMAGSPALYPIVPFTLTDLRFNGGAGPVAGCTNPAATNYNRLATVDDGSCILPVRGCTNSAATNYNRLATVDDGSCVFPVIVAGCTDPRATNYNPTATVDNGSCVLPAAPVRGCTDPAAINYNGLAAQSDGSCQYAVPVPTQAPPFVAACPCLWTATLLPIKAWAIVVPPVGTWIQKPC